MSDVVVVGAGIAGLTAAWELRDADVLVLEAEERVGGRIRSERRGDYWISVGAHLFPGEGSVVGGLVAEFGLETLPVRGDLAAIYYRGKLLKGVRPELVPFQLPLSLAGRLSFVRAGLKVKRGAKEYARLARRAPGEREAVSRMRVLSYEADRTFAEFLGPLHPEAEEIFRALARRSTLEPEEMAAGSALAMFAHVWASDDMVLGLNMRGGASVLPTAMARALGDRILLGARVTELAGDGDGVRVRYVKDGEEREERTRAAVVAAPSYVAREIVRDLPEETARALDGIVFGPYFVGGVLTNEREGVPWDDIYAVLSIGTCFNMLFNHANCLRDPGEPRQPGGALMVYGGADNARRMLERSDEEIKAAIEADIERIFPEARGVVEEILLLRLPRAIPYHKPGRHLLQPPLEAGVHDRIFFAGDWVGEWTHMESAAETGSEAAAKARRRLSAAVAG